MSSTDPLIVFTENLVSRIHKTVSSLSAIYPGIKVYTSEEELLEFMQTRTPDIIFLQLDLEPNDAVMIVREIRKTHPQSPPYIVIYSDKQDDFVQELAFNSEADSFIGFYNKPAIMQGFIRNLLRRKKEAQVAVRKKIVLDADRYVIYNRGEALQLPRKEFRLFELLYNNAGKFFSKPEIAESIWHDASIAKKRSIDVHIYNIRQLFGKRIIQSQKGKGYRISLKMLAG